MYFTSCRNNENNSEQLKKEIMNVDKDFSNLSAQKGFQNAFLAYASDDVVLFRQNNYPVIGKGNLKKLYDSRPKTDIILTWEPLKADVSSDAFLGYSYGKWVQTGKDSLGKEEKNFGVYVTIWKKQSDNSWKFVLDGGNSTPPPK